MAHKRPSLGWKVHFDTGLISPCGTRSPMYTTGNVHSVTCKRCKAVLSNRGKKRPMYNPLRNHFIVPKPLLVSERRIVNNVLDEHVNKRLHDSIPLDAIQKVLAMNDLVMLQEDNSEWSGLLSGESYQTTINIAKRNTWTQVNGVSVYSPIPNSMLFLSWYRYGTGRYEVLAYLT